MKTVLMASLMLFGSATTFANTNIERAKELFQKRGESRDFALEAARLFRSTYSELSDEFEKAQAKINESEAYYFVGTHSSSKKTRKSMHQAGFNAAQIAINHLQASYGEPKNESYRTPLARAYYFYGANLGKWGEARGVIRSLAKWPELKRKTLLVTRLDETVEQYGAYRILGRGFLKVPRESSSQAFEYIAKAYNETLTTIGEDTQISRNTTTMLYYMEIAKKINKINEFCEAFYAMEELSELDEEDLKGYAIDPARGDHNRMPEVSDDIKAFQNDSKIQAYARSNC